MLQLWFSSNSPDHYSERNSEFKFWRKTRNSQNKLVWTSSCKLDQENWKCQGVGKLCKNYHRRSKPFAKNSQLQINQKFFCSEEIDGATILSLDLEDFLVYGLKRPHARAVLKRIHQRTNPKSLETVCRRLAIDLVVTKLKWQDTSIRISCTMEDKKSLDSLRIASKCLNKVKKQIEQIVQSLEEDK